MQGGGGVWLLRGGRGVGEEHQGCRRGFWRIVDMYKASGKDQEFFIDFIGGPG